MKKILFIVLLFSLFIQHIFPSLAFTPSDDELFLLQHLYDTATDPELKTTIALTLAGGNNLNTKQQKALEYAVQKKGTSSAETATETASQGSATACS